MVDSHRPAPPHSPGGLYGGARSQNPRPKALFYLGSGGHLDPKNMWSIDLSRRGVARGVFNFPVFIQISKAKINY